MGNQSLGKKGETLAQELLASKGLEIVCCNWHAPRHLGIGGEIDIIALDQQQKTLVFAEVKTRRNNNFGAPAESVSVPKQLRMQTLAELYLQNTPAYAHYNMRFDVIAILQSPGRPPEIDHFENAL